MKICCATPLVCFLLAAAMLSSSGKEALYLVIHRLQYIYTIFSFEKYDMSFLSKFSVFLSTSQISALNRNLFVFRTYKLCVGSDVVP